MIGFYNAHLICTYSFKEEKKKKHHALWIIRGEAQKREWRMEEVAHEGSQKERNMGRWYK